MGEVEEREGRGGEGKVEKGLGKASLDLTPKVQSIKGKIEKLDCIRTEFFIALQKILLR